MIKLFSSARKRSAALGRQGESAACNYLISCGMTILARNWRCRAGELDIVALDGKEIVFAEVKTMRFKKNFTPYQNLSTRQRRRNCSAASVYLKSLDITGYSARFDLIEVTCGNFFVRHLVHRKHYLPPLPPLEI